MPNRLVGVLAVLLVLGAGHDAAVAGTDHPSAQVPVLMYHVIAAPYAGAPYPDLYLRKPEFSAEVGWLARHGYHAVTLRRVYDSWHGTSTLPPHPVVLTFDDGYRSQYVNALPVLRARNWPGVLNLKVKNLEFAWGLSPRRVRALIAAGWELDAHTITHPDLTTVSDEQLEHEVAGSRKILQRMFGVPVDFFCYPSGRYDDRVIAAVRSAGYLGATTTRYGLAVRSEPFTLRRVRINGSDRIDGFAAKLLALTP